ncbi:hypothetical protein BVG19_g1081 [[Candida] boidinii]|nr:hypothetical protein BVG19_g1081 [[Candida] boidinii]OWB50690.1 hypothetical protein B5S27_g2242 [[Candida] boidinii]
MFRNSTSKAVPVLKSGLSTRYFSNNAIKTQIYVRESSSSITSSSCCRSRSLLTQYIPIRNVHQTSKKQLILESIGSNSKYASMNLQGLKMECKMRGLKVSGRKLDLVQRLTHNDQISHLSSSSSNKSFSTLNTNKPVTVKQAKQQQQQQPQKEDTKNFSTSKPKEILINSIKPIEQTQSKKQFQERSFTSTTTSNAKGDSSTIEFYKVPQNDYPAPDGRPPMKIPSLSSKASSKIAELDTNFEPKLQATTLKTDSQVTHSGTIINDVLTTEDKESSSNDHGYTETDKIIFATAAVLTGGWLTLMPSDGRN